MDSGARVGVDANPDLPDIRAGGRVRAAVALDVEGVAGAVVELDDVALGILEPADGDIQDVVEIELRGWVERFAVGVVERRDVQRVSDEPSWG